MKRLVSLYSGCGGLDLGLQWAGFRTVACIEKDADACASLRANHVSDVIIEANICDVAADDVLNRAKLTVGELDLLAGGPPCPPYSKSRFYRKEKPRALGDPTSDTLGEYLRMLDDLRPKAFLLENVPGLAYKVHQDALDLILSRAAELGYHTRYQVLNAADYGVPQIRERLFIIGALNGPPTFPEATHGEGESQLSLLSDREPWVTAGPAIADLDTAENSSDEGHKAGGRHNYLLPLIPPGDNYLFFTAERGHPEPLFKWRSRYWSFLLKLSPDKPAWTIQARRSNNMGPFHWRNRILRIEEIKRLQTFPDAYELCGKVDSAWRQIGNAVPPLLAKCLGQSMMSHLAPDAKNGRKRRTDHTTSQNSATRVAVLG